MAIQAEQAVQEGVASATRKTPRRGDFAPGASRHTPTALALSERQRADLWKVVGIIVSLAALVLAWLIVQAGRSTERIFVMDAGGNITAGALESLAKSRGYFNRVSIFTSNVALQRSPAGLDLYDMVPILFTPRAAEKLTSDLKNYEEDIRKRNLQEKPIIEYISDPVEAASTRLVEVKGRLVMAGAYSGKVFYDEREFRLTLTYGRNPNAGELAAYPWVVEDFDLKIIKEDRR